MKKKTTKKIDEKEEKDEKKYTNRKRYKDKSINKGRERRKIVILDER